MVVLNIKWLVIIVSYILTTGNLLTYLTNTTFQDWVWVASHYCIYSSLSTTKVSMSSQCV